MSSGNPDRALRNGPRPDYTDAAADKKMSEALALVHDDRAPLDLDDKELDVNENHAVDKTYHDTGDTDTESDASDEFEEDEDGNKVPVVRKKKPKSPAEVAAEQQVALGIGVSYPEGFKETRKDIRYAYTACSRGGDVEGVAYALNRLVPTELPLSDQDRATVVRMAAQCAEGVRFPKQYLANTFEPLTKFNGGSFTKTWMNINTLWAICLGVQAAEDLSEFRTKGSAQAQGLEAVLGIAGLYGDVVSILTAQHADETPEESTLTASQKIVEKLNALTDAELVSTLYSNLAGFKKRSLALPGAQPLKTAYDFSHMDTTKIKGYQEVAKHKGVITVSVTLLHRNDPADEYCKFLTTTYGDVAAVDATNYKHCRGFRDSAFKATKTQEDLAKTQAANNLHMNEPEELKAARLAYATVFEDKNAKHIAELGEDAWVAKCTALKGALDNVHKKLFEKEATKLLANVEAAYNKRYEGVQYLETHREQVDIPLDRDYSRGHVLAKMGGAFKSMLLSTEQEHTSIGTKLKDFLASIPDELGEHMDTTADGLDPDHPDYFGLPNDSYLAMKINGCPVKLGKQKPRSRMIHLEDHSNLHRGVLHPHKSTQLQTWIKMDLDVTLEDMVAFIPPWKLDGPGTIEFFVLMTSTPPEDVISLGKVAAATYEDNARKAGAHYLCTPEFQAEKSKMKQGFYADMKKNQGHNPAGIEKKNRYTTHEKEMIEKQRYEAEKKAVHDWKTANPFAEREPFKMNYPREYLADNPLGKTVSKRKRVRDDAKTTKEAKANHQHVVAADPEHGGSDIDNTTGFGSD